MLSIPTDYVSIPKNVSIPKLTKLSTGESNRVLRAVLWRFPKPSTNSNKGGH